MIILSESYDMALAAAIPICHVMGWFYFRVLQLILDICAIFK
jgi:hypothetical protein